MKNRKILLDTETTGLDPLNGDRIVEIACLELFDDSELGNSFHVYINPQRNIPEESSKVHGITEDKVKNSPIFSQIADDFVNFVGDSKIIAHNSEFDRKFINNELSLVGKAIYEFDRCIDTLKLAQKMFPKQRNTLDALCDRFSIDRTARSDFHGALIDIKLLRDVYVNLIKGQKSIFESLGKDIIETSADNIIYKSDFLYRSYSLSKEEEEANLEFLKKIKNSIWIN